MYDGRFVRNTHTVIGKAPPFYGGLTMYSHDPASDRIRFHYFTSTGAVSTGELQPDGDGFVIPERHVGADGGVTELETRFRRDGEYAYRTETRKKTATGWQPMMSLRYLRSDAPEARKENATLRHAGSEWRLAWNSNRDGNWEIYRQDADGSARNLSNRASNDWLWSVHDDMVLGLSSERAEDEAKGWRGVALDAGALRRLSVDTIGDGFIDCHPRGVPCAADVRIDGKRRIAFFGADGQRTGLLGDGGSEEADPQFSPDGTQLLFRSNRDGHWELWLGDAWGRNPERLTSDPGNDAIAAHEYGGEGPARFSPDGRRIAWMRKFPGAGYDVWTMAADGSDAQNLTQAHAGDDAYPSWSPDGRWIAFDSDRDDNNEVYVMDASGGAPRRITFDPGSDIAPLWMPAEPGSAQ
jgi:TolB protein